MNLITGGTGLVGSHLLLLLLENNENVRAIYRSEKNKEKTRVLFELYKKEHFFEKIEWVQADINDIPTLEKAFEGITHVYHCAAYVSLSSSRSEEHTSELQSRPHLVCRLLLEKKNK